MNAPDRRGAVGLFILAFVAYAWFFSGGGWNQNAHFDLARALVERGTLSIDGYHVNTGDVSERGGHVYINKPPGASMLAAIPYALIYSPERVRNVPVDTWRVMTANAWFVTALTCGVLGALIPAVLFLYLRRRANASPRAAILVALATAFGTLVFPYSTMLFAQVPAALFLLLAFTWLDERPLLAGVAAGMAGITFYLCIPAAIVLLIASLGGGQAILPVRTGTGTGRIACPPLRFIAGGVPFALFLVAYQYLCFGSPFQTSIESSSAFVERDLVLGVFRAPSLEALHGLTFREFRGLFIISPVLLLAFVGAVVMLRRRVMRRELAMIVTIFAIFLFANAGFNGWHGGSAFGPRYLLPSLPLLAIPLVFVWRPLVLALALVSATIHLVVTAVDPLPTAVMPHPLRMYHFPVFMTGDLPDWTVAKLNVPSKHVGEVSINVQSIDEYGPYHLRKPGSHETTWAAFNAGEFLTGPARRASVLPIVLWILGGGAFLMRRS